MTIRLMADNVLRACGRIDLLYSGQFRIIIGIQDIHQPERIECMRRQSWMILLSGILVLAAAPGFGEVKPHILFTDHLVLQQGMSVPVWGTADDGEEVTVEFQGHTISTTAEDGKWKVELEPMEAGGPYEMLIRGKNHEVRLNDVMIGEVWICSGQSNMQWSVAASHNAEAEIQAADYPNIRMYTIPRIISPEPLETISREGRNEQELQWLQVTPETIGRFSAVGYYFGRHLHEALDVPIGLISTNWGGTPAEAWTSKEGLASHPQLAKLTEEWEQRIATYEKELAKWQEETDRLTASAGGQEVELPKKPDDPNRNPWRASGLFNAMINPLIPYAIQGAIWYQGESNASRAQEYQLLFRTMIQDWRNQWKQEDMTFLFVQLANFNPRNMKEDAWAELREAQHMAMDLPHTGMAVTTDIGDPEDIHPRNKQEVGRRLALAALEGTYGKDIVSSGPLYKDMEIKDGEVHIIFDEYANCGLYYKDAPELRGFTIAGENGNFVEADARIVGNTVVVSSPEVKNPRIVRYNWHNNPTGNLYNMYGLPAAPFRTDFPEIPEIGNR